MASNATPDEIAAFDQIDAELSDDIRRVREHWAEGDCEHGGGAVTPVMCIGAVVMAEINSLSETDARAMYMEALIRLAKGCGDDGGAAPGD